MFKLRRDFAVEDFFPTSRLMQERENYYRWATYKEVKFPTICDTSAALYLQATNSDKPYVTTRPMWNEYVEDGPQET